MTALFSKLKQSQLIATALTIPFLVAAPNTAHAGATAALAKAKTFLDDTSTAVATLGVTVATLAVMFVGFKMMWRAGQWADLAPIFWGGIMVGGAVTISSAFF